MGKIGLIWVMIAFIFGACSPDKVKIKGKIEHLTGTVKLLAEIPGKGGMDILEQQEVTDGDIAIVTKKLKIPARVWIDVAGKKTLEFIVDSKNRIWIEGTTEAIDEITVNGSVLETEYDKVRKIFKEKYEDPKKKIDLLIEKIRKKGQLSKDDEVLWGIYQLQQQRYDKYRARYTVTLIEANRDKELSLFLLQDELKDSVDLQKRLFKGMDIRNEESNVYKMLEEKLK